MGRLLRTKSLQGVNSLSFLSFLDSPPLGEFLNHVDWASGAVLATRHTVPHPTPARLQPFLVSSFPEMPFPTLL